MNPSQHQMMYNPNNFGSRRDAANNDPRQRQAQGPLVRAVSRSSNQNSVCQGNKVAPQHQTNSSQIQKPQSIQLNSMAMHQKQSSDYNYNSVNLDSSASRKDYLNCSSKSKNTSAIKASVQKKSMQDSLNEQAR